MPKRSSTPPRDPNVAAHRLVHVATGGVLPTPEPSTDKNPAAVELGRRGGLIGGKARAEALTRKERQAIAAKAALARWKSHKKR